MEYIGGMSDHPSIGYFQLGRVKLSAAELIMFAEGHRYAEAHWQMFKEGDQFQKYTDTVYPSVVLMIFADPSPSKAALQGYCAALETQVRKLMCADHVPNSNPNEKQK